ncbi:hypothetical protein F6R98_11635 [Candidatus Methylospira mobilis]|uniref:ABC-type transport auxiliary lipoprotein component domain-containing protein n=1 Tax=Candidatus Methylospira mobilis TaxID=1808979 RepID=A0A5Q0BHZ9_9GAMM|nr:hypothetical protein [Candidatus Methylospira mobilis]QFY43189.1 hypothetical protein F6R98_11635 [Candidatus Methylospira mobilis]
MVNRLLLFRLFIILALLHLEGCATTALPDAGLIKRYDYGYTTPKLTFALHSHLIVVDLRPEIISGHKAPGYVGEAFNVFGAPIDVTNADGCQAMHTTHTTERCLPFHESVYNAILRPGGGISDSYRLFVIINQWKTGIRNGLALNYDLAAIVEDKDRNVVAKTHIMGSDESIDTSGIGAIHFRNHNQAAEEMSKIVSGALARKLEILLGGDIAQALRNHE